MSITFMSDCARTTFQKVEPCLCTQCCEAFSRMFSDGEDNEAIRAELKAEANPECFSCKGSGIEMFEESDAPELNLANDNMLRLLAVLGLSVEYCGEMTLPEARRAIMRGRARDVSGHVRNRVERHGAPRDCGEGVVELRPLHFLDVGLDEDGIRERVERFSAFVLEAERRGATKIWWG